MGVGPMGMDTRMLDKRSRLVFNFPKEGGPGKGHYMFFIPFYENPVIKESKKANYAKYKIMSRASSLYSYTGAESRQFKISFNMTLPHLMQHDMGIDRYRRLITTDSKYTLKKLFFENGKGIESANLSEGAKNRGSVRRYEAQFLKLLDENGGDATDVNGKEGHGTEGRHKVTMSRATNWTVEKAFENYIYLLPKSYLQKIEYLRSMKRGPSKTDLQKGLDTLLYFINLVRSSVYNNAEDPSLGPPEVRLEYGAMYQSIPCICTQYNVSVDEKAGYDLTTLLPRRIKFSMSLEELRAGDFTKYEGVDVNFNNSVVKRDNLSGWEVMVDEPLNLDPGEIVI
jgi:hypothetical protein